MSILFIIHDLYQEDNHFPLNIGYLSAVLIKQGFDVKICCMDLFHYTNIELTKYLQKEHFDLIGISFLASRFIETVLPLCKVINKYKKDAWLVLGGHGPSPIPKYMIEKTNADIVCIGESEDMIVELLKCKIGDGDLSNINGIAYKYGIQSSIIINERRTPIRSLDSIPFPEWSLFPMKKYSNCLEFPGMDKNDKLLPIITSRGCINRCNFCYRMEKGIRLRSIKNVVSEMIILNIVYGITYFNICDELFGYPKKRVFEFQEELERQDLHIKYFCAVRVDTVDKEILQSLKESGCKFLNFGFESSDQKVLDLMHKNTTVKQNMDALELSKEIGFNIGLNFIWGNYGDTKKSLMDNVQIIKKYSTYSQLRTIRPVTPYPGCELYYDAIEKGLLKDPKDFFRKFKNSDLITVNFTKYPLDVCYQLLYKANKELINDYYSHISKNYKELKTNWINEAYPLIQNFYNLYFNDNTRFRGARHYGKI